MKKILAVLLVAVFAVLWFASGVLAQDNPGFVWKNNDSEYALNIRYMGTKAATVTVTTAKITLSDDGNETDINLSTAAEDQAAILAVTNAAGAKNFDCKLWGSIGADVTTNVVIALGATALVAGEWTPLLKWDSSACLHEDAVVSQMVGNNVFNPQAITRIVGDPIGTGNVTVNWYQDGTKMYQGTITSPVYTPPSSYSIITMSGSTDVVTRVTNTVTYVADPVVTVNVPITAKLQQGKVVFARLTRATTMTTTLGGIGVATQN